MGNTPGMPNPAIVRVRVTERAVGGVHVRLEMTDGSVRTAWVPDGILEVAKQQLRAGQSLVTPTDGGPRLGRSAGDLIGILCSHAPARWDEALYEASWVGPSPLSLSSATPDQAAIRSTHPDIPGPSLDLEAPSPRLDQDTVIVVALAAGAALALSAVAVLVFVVVW